MMDRGGTDTLYAVRNFLWFGGRQYGCLLGSVARRGVHVLFVYLSDVFLGVARRCICKSSEDVQTCFCLCVHDAYVFHSKS